MTTIDGLANEVEKAGEDWARVIAELTASKPDSKEAALAEMAKEFGDSLDSVAPLIRTCNWRELRSALATARVQVEALADGLKSALEEHYGTGVAESIRFREFQAEMQAAFPAANFDRAQEISSTLRALAEWSASSEVRSALEGMLLVTGTAGVGKTHSLCDEAQLRLESGLATILLFGWQFRTAPVWEQIRLHLGLSPDWDREALLDALDALGETTGRPVLLCIDALNESSPRNLWLSELVSITHSLEEREFVRLCISCRTGYVGNVLPESLDIPLVEHPGFAGMEFNACKSFFDYYELKPPIGPLLHPEFSNPLFLRLVCEALSAAGLAALPDGWSGLREALRVLLDARDAEYEAKHGVRGHKAISHGLESIARCMAAQGKRWLSMAQSREALVESQVSNPDDVLQQLLDDELLLKVPGSGAPGLLGTVEDDIVFAFERLGDHLLVQARIQVAEGRELPANLLEEADAEPGIAEALCVQLPELRGVEFLDALEDVGREVTTSIHRAWLQSLALRVSTTFTERTEAWLLRGMEREILTKYALDAMLTLALRGANRFDAAWFSGFLGSVSMPNRDSFLCPYLHAAWHESGDGSRPVSRLIQAAWPNGPTAVDRRTRADWMTVLCWFLAAADRRVRDKATRALVSLSQEALQVWEDVLPNVLEVDDDYIAERVLLALYGALLRKPHEDGPDVSDQIGERFLGASVHPNANVRDAALCILTRLGTYDPEVHRCSGESGLWPLKVPTAEELEPFNTIEMRERYPRLYKSLNLTYFGDFGIYVVPSALHPYRDAVDPESACRWLFQEILDLGYEPQLHARYDWYTVQKFGSGRSHPAWAERIGKKYQWIALGRLLGTLADHVEAVSDPYDTEEENQSPLIAQGLRDIDPSVIAPEEELTSSLSVDLMSERERDDSLWAEDANEITQLADKLWSDDGNWVPLEAHCSWVDRHTVEGDRGFRRQIWIQVRSYLVPSNSFTKLWDWARGQNYMGRWMPEGRQLLSCYLGEYPAGPSFAGGLPPTRPTTGFFGDKQPPVAVTPTTLTIVREFSEDCSGATKANLGVPAPQLLAGMAWNAGGGYVDSEGRVCFLDPSFPDDVPVTDRFSGCIANSRHLIDYLDKSGQSILWTVLAEKLPGDYHSIKRLEYSHVRGLHQGKLRKARTPVLARS